MKRIFLLFCTFTATLNAQPDCLRKAEQLIKVENYTEAVRTLYLCSSSIDQAAMIGLVYHRLYKPDSALHYLQKAYEAGHYDDNLLLSYSEALLWKKNVRKAKEV
ncbi:MAG: hypothetical protein GF350_17095, partial [Chitinivibrionales bacterium]|nr:hypothetical protein [Chitinivibrionales bacterium]